MFIDRGIVARAFAKAGEEPITEEEWNDATSNRVRIVKEFYLAVLLETLASYDWTSQKKRVRLDYIFKEVEEPQETELARYWILDDNDKWQKATAWDPNATYYEIDNDENYTTYKYIYPLPADCEKVVSINDGNNYSVEGAFLFCNDEMPILLYIKNYWTGKYEYVVVEDPNPDDIDKYWVKNADGTYEKAESYVMGTTYYVIVEHDYNFYDQPQLDPTLSAYFECKLAANIALKLTGGTDKYQMLYNEATIIANNAMKKSAEQARNRTKGNPWWTQQLGLE